MALFNRQKSSDIPPELQPYYEAPATQTRGGIRWIFRVLIALVILVLLFFLVRWAWHEAHTSSNNTKTSTSQGRSSSGRSSATNSGQTNKSSQPTQNSSTTPAPSTSSTPATTPPSSTSSNPSTSPNTSTQSNSPSGTSPTNGKLTNTGPGNTVALFAATTLGGVLIYQWRLRQKQTS